jgi:DNA replication initiation complex subunit (GINS family)
VPLQPMSEEADFFPRLSEQRRLEYQSKSELSRLPSGFYSSVKRYLEGLRSEVEQALREAPTSRRTEMIQRTYQQSLKLARDLVETRMAKIAALAAQLAGPGAGGPLPPLGTEDQELLDSVRDRLREHRDKVAPYLRDPAPAPRAVPSPSSDMSPAVPEASRRSSEEAIGAQATFPVLVRVLKDTPEIEVAPGDRLAMRKEDVATVPPAVARILVEGGLAEVITEGGAPPQ